MPDLLSILVEKRGSDLHLAAGKTPAMRVDGAIHRMHGLGTVDHAWMAAEAERLGPRYDAEEFARRASADFGVTEAGRRFRVNLFRSAGGLALVARLLEDEFRDFEALGLPRQVERFAEYESGLVLICGATGSGKSTSLASIVNRINETSARHILTIEDPIEYVHEDRGGIVRQRELNADTPDFASAVRAALREDPDVILVGEMRDVETMRAALTAAETGHLVLSTLHTGDVVGSVRRLVGAFPAEEQDAARLRVSQSTRAVMAQHLLPARGGGRTPAVELMFLTTAIRHLIAANKLDQIQSAVESGGAEGMRTLEQSLAGLVREGLIHAETAEAHCRDPDAMARLLRR
ncbi:MAG: PilT/PilU family type 4a pilus ATPase [Pseudomonadota bacterium]